MNVRISLPFSYQVYNWLNFLINLGNANLLSDYTVMLYLCLLASVHF